MSPVVDRATTRSGGKTQHGMSASCPQTQHTKESRKEQNSLQFLQPEVAMETFHIHVFFPPECYTVILFPCPQTHTRSAQVSLTGLASQISPGARSHLHNRNTVTQCTAPGTVTGSRHHNPLETLGACRWDKAASWGVSGSSANSVSQADAQGGPGAKGWPGLCLLLSLKLSGPEEGSAATLTPGTEAPRSTGRVFLPS